jgi:hypothetical protein
MKHPSFGSIQIESVWVEVFVEAPLAVIEKVRKMVTQSGKCGVINRKLQVTSE